LDNKINSDLLFENQKIVDIDMEKEVKKSFIEYSMSVIVARALPDVRDGLKPVHRRILYAMYEDHLTHDRAFRKSATTVGNVLGRYHPHGDTAVYDSMVRMAQPFSLRYPLVEGHGNFGNIDGDEAAAYRYTEARLSAIADYMTADIEKNVVKFIPNFDNRREEPEVLPARFPTLLVNGSMGIAVGMATNIPPHNMGEVIDGVIYMMDNPDVTVPELMNYIKGPDFPTYAAIYGTAGIMEAYLTGRGRVMVRAKAEIDEDKRRIIVTEIPYQVNKTNMVEAMADCVKDKRIEGITDIRDESGRAGLRVVIEYRRDANGAVILNQLYKFTQLQDTFAINMVALVNGIPKTLGLREILGHYIKHQEEVIENRFLYELEKAKREAHLNEGYKMAVDNIDEIIRIIRSSESIPEARAALRECRFTFSENDNLYTLLETDTVLDSIQLSEDQAQAIVDMTLGRLSGLERKKIDDRLERLYAQISEVEAILADADKVAIKETIKTELLEIKRRFGDERRTEILPVEDEIILEDLIERHTCLITLTHAGYIKRRNSDLVTAQRRGGKGVIGMATKEEDFVEKVIAAHSHSYLLMFTNLGRMHVRKAYQIPEAARTAKGTNIANILELDSGEKITAIISVDEFKDDEYLLMVTKYGKIKRSFLSLYEPKRVGGKIALNLLDDDELVFVGHTHGDVEILIATHNGYAVRFNENALTPQGRTAMGVKALRLVDDDYIKGAALVDEDKYLLVVTENGYGKRNLFSEYPTHNRGAKGVICQKPDKRGFIAGIATVSEDDDIMMITNDGSLVRTPASGISVIGRNTGGVKMMRINDGAKIVNITRLDSNDEEDETDEDEEA
jgi:DNA gyrase, A subunit